MMRFQWGAIFVGGVLALGGAAGPGGGTARAQGAGGNPPPRTAATADGGVAAASASGVTPPAVPGPGRPSYTAVPAPAPRVPIWKRVLNYFSDGSDDAETPVYVRDPSTGRTVSAIGRSAPQPPR